MKEVISLVRCWSTDTPSEEQIWIQQRADDEFAWYCEQVKQAGITVSPVRRSTRTITTTDSDDLSARSSTFVMYALRAWVIGTKPAMQYIKGWMDKKLPPIVECRHIEWKAFTMYLQENHPQILVLCCFCPGAFTLKTLWYQGTRRYRVPGRRSRQQPTRSALPFLVNSVASGER